MQFHVLLTALVGIASTGLAAPVENTVLARANPPVGTRVTCGEVPAGHPKLKARDVHVWERLDPLKIDYRDPDDKNVGFHKDLNELQDVIGGQHYDVLFGTVQSDLKFKYRAVGLQFAESWIKTHPSGKGAAIEFYNEGVTDAGETKQCYYRGIIAKGSAITSATSAANAAKNHYHGKTYEVNVNDCVTSTNYILGDTKF